MYRKQKFKISILTKKLNFEMFRLVVPKVIQLLKTGKEERK